MTEYMSIEEYAALPPDQRRLKHERPKRGKYNNVKVQIDGHTFDSKAEAQRYEYLRRLEQAGIIQALRVHPVYQLQPAFIDNTGKRQRAITYEGDFAYLEDGRDVVEDVKGKVLDVYAVKRKLFLFCYPAIEFRQIDVAKAHGSKRRRG